MQSNAFGVLWDYPPKYKPQSHVIYNCIYGGNRVFFFYTLLYLFYSYNYIMNYYYFYNFLYELFTNFYYIFYFLKNKHGVSVLYELFNFGILDSK